MKKVFREVHFYAAAFFSTDKMLFVYTFENVFFRYYKHSYNHPLEFHSCILHAYTSGAYATGLGHQGPTCKAAVTLGGGDGKVDQSLFRFWFGLCNHVFVVWTDMLRIWFNHV